MTGYAVYFNKRHRRSGHLFQNRYKSIICEEDPYLLELVRYIHLNPLKAGLVEGLDELDNYPWAGHSVIMGKQRNGWQAVDEVLLYFSDKREKARKEYRKFVAGGIKQEERPDLEGNLFKKGKKDRERSDERILGSGDFVAQILKESENMAERRRNKVPLSKLIDGVCNQFGLSRDDLLSSSRRKNISKTRAVISYFTVREMGYSCSEVGNILRIDLSNVSRAVNRGKEICSNNEKLKEKLLETQ